MNVFGCRTNKRPRIGLAWSGRPSHDNDHNRSIDLTIVFVAIGRVQDATYVSLLREVRADDAPVLQGSDVLHFGKELKTYADTAALIANLDLVISVDTSVAHLAGALAKPVWILLPFIPDWRWLLDRDDSPWYPDGAPVSPGQPAAGQHFSAPAHRLDDFLHRK